MRASKKFAPCQLLRYRLGMKIEKTPWQRRAIDVGLRQQALVILTDHDKTVISRWLRDYRQSGIPKHIRSIIIAWELMTPEQRAAWLQGVEQDSDGSAEPSRPPG